MSSFPYALPTLVYLPASSPRPCGYQIRHFKRKCPKPNSISLPQGLFAQSSVSPRGPPLRPRGHPFPSLSLSTCSHWDIRTTQPSKPAPNLRESFTSTDPPRSEPATCLFWTTPESPKWFPCSLFLSKGQRDGPLTTEIKSCHSCSQPGFSSHRRGRRVLPGPTEDTPRSDFAGPALPRAHSAPSDLHPIAQTGQAPSPEA